MKKMLSCTALFSLTLAVGSVSALTLEEQMGRHVYMDKALSLNRTQSCATCHHRSSGFTDPANSRDPFNSMVSIGDDGVSKGGRNSPTSAYAGFSPVLSNATGEWIGGMFWDGRATGEILGDPLAEQAQGPPRNPVEMNLALAGDVVIRVSESPYAHLYTEYFNPNFFDIYGDDATDDGYLDDRADAAYEQIARMVATYERSPEVSPFDSRFDRNELNTQEEKGLALFDVHCAACHSLDPVTGAAGPLFTNYGYANIGVPVNERLQADPDTVYDGYDLGLGYVKEGENGKFKVPTLRNIALTAPYSHNGYFTSLFDMVAFINDRGDLLPEIPDNLSDQVGNLKLTNPEIDDLVAFLNALNDGRGKMGNGR